MKMDETTIDRWYYWRNDGERVAAKTFVALGMDTRTINCLLNEKILTLEDLVKKTPSQLLKFDGFGHKSLAQVVNALDKRGLALTDETWGDAKLKDLIANSNKTREALQKAGRKHKLALARVKDRRRQLGY